MALFDATRATTKALIAGSCRPTVTGLENFPARGPVIVAPNHLSFFDSVIVQALMPRKVAFFAKAEYFTSKGPKGVLWRWFFNSVGSIPVERGEQAASVAALQTALRILEAGDCFGIYPEGTRSRDGQLYRGRTGVGWLALTTGAPVVPVGLIGTEQLQPADAMTIKPRHFTMHVGEPIYFDKLGPDHSLPARRAATDRIMDSIAGLTGQPRAGGYNQSKSVD
ncbi:1-acyl-sn-glycerol-3-phosphate acyltransferase [Paenarthrobacter sp. DKR-5]|uniref:lysophospholipid acyltransferase family protein n=1 Tax=Paenarthrobacter sp. DKR-5 TaxID=2835535 RepID=UPI001BDBE981|nr:lysophospholipid acyltransferase family protein [Paenarthrobacter sp. DKR-5]MBT1001871.1 1-acyl-sn-glycerol-3-phosphate acyltransferase [Paenarthrobacter sp. DKR-5]